MDDIVIPIDHKHDELVRAQSLNGKVSVKEAYNAHKERFAVRPWLKKLVEVCPSENSSLYKESLQGSTAHEV